MKLAEMKDKLFHLQSDMEYLENQMDRMDHRDPDHNRVMRDLREATMKVTKLKARIADQEELREI